MSALVDKLVGVFEADPVLAGQSLISNSNPDVFDAIHVLLDTLDVGQQVEMLAILMGLKIAAMEGLDCEAETHHQTLISGEDRIRLFIAQVKAAYAAGLEIHNHPDFPRPDKGRRM